MASTSITIRDYQKELPGIIVVKDGIDTYEFPAVSSKNSRGQDLRWQIYVRVFATDQTPQKIPAKFFDNSPLPQGYYAYTFVESGIVGMKIKEITPTITAAGKNIGKANATNAFTQALRDAYSKHNKQSQKTTGDNKDIYFPPMLADNFRTVNKLPPLDNSWIQVKIDGVRAVATYVGGEVKMYSRTRKEFPKLENIKESLSAIFAEFTPPKLQEMLVADVPLRLYIDGEVYKHGRRLQEISGATRRTQKTKKTDTIELEYHIFDCFIPELPNLQFSRRLDVLNAIFAKSRPQNLVRVPTAEVSTKEEIMARYQTYLDAKYEGAMIRFNLPYSYSYNGYHSQNMLKLKQSFDDEFKIVDFTCGEKGKSAGDLILILETKDGKQFNLASFEGIELEERKKLYLELSADNNKKFNDEYRGKYITVEYQDLSKDGIPARAVAREGLINVRDFDE